MSAISGEPSSPSRIPVRRGSTVTDQTPASNATTSSLSESRADAAIYDHNASTGLQHLGHGVTPPFESSQPHLTSSASTNVHITTSSSLAMPLSTSVGIPARAPLAQPAYVQPILPAPSSGPPAFLNPVWAAGNVLPNTAVVPIVSSHPALQYLLPFSAQVHTPPIWSGTPPFSFADSHSHMALRHSPSLPDQPPYSMFPPPASAAAAPYPLTFAPNGYLPLSASAAWQSNTPVISAENSPHHLYRGLADRTDAASSAAVAARQSALPPPKLNALLRRLGLSDSASADSLPAAARADASRTPPSTRRKGRFQVTESDADWVRLLFEPLWMRCSVQINCAVVAVAEKCSGFVQVRLGTYGRHSHFPITSAIGKRSYQKAAIVPCIELQRSLRALARDSTCTCHRVFYATRNCQYFASHFGRRSEQCSYFFHTIFPVQSENSDAWSSPQCASLKSSSYVRPSQAEGCASQNQQRQQCT